MSAFVFFLPKHMILQYIIYNIVKFADQAHSFR